MKVEIRIDGMDDLKMGLQRVGRVVDVGDLRDSLMEAALPLEELMQAKAPRREDGASQSGYKHIGRFPDRLEPAVHVGPSRDGFYLNFAEFGTGPRTRKNGGSTGTMPARPFMRPAADESESEVAQTFARVQGRKIEVAGRGG